VAGDKGGPTRAYRGLAAVICVAPQAGPQRVLVEGSSARVGWLLASRRSESPTPKAMSSNHQPTAQQSPLSEAEVTQFFERGYHLLPSFLDLELCEVLKQEVDQFWQDQVGAPGAFTKEGPGKFQLEYREHGRLLTEPRLMAMLNQLMGGTEFSFHHLHTARHDAGCPGIGWHQDYEQLPQTNRSHLMVHVFFYLNGLDGSVGDLQLLPGSHKRVMARDAMQFLGTEALPGMLVLDNVPAGTAVIVHSALLHARRAKPGGEGRPRYFIDSSYCQAGVLWPAYPHGYRRMLARALELGLGEGGRYDFLFDAERFYDAREANQRLLRVNQGSLVRFLPEE
jgi:hypothetical protein